ncbi:MAG: dephospho-CoA kinase [Dehalococcoidales bacterium]|nr:dephospho-CoA kinase [Dehalococcoidales bacterium]
MKVIGLTGGIGSGKSTVAQFLVELGAVLLDADKTGHEVFQTGTEGWQEVVATFGRRILTSDENVDRKKLGEIVFDDSESLSRLNQIMHPRIFNMIKTQLEKYRQQGIKVVIIEAPLLFEAGWASLADEIWVTTAPEATILKRLKKRSGLSKAKSLARISSQLPSPERTSRADVIINTDCSLVELKLKIKKLWQKLLLDTRQQ